MKTRSLFAIMIVAVSAWTQSTASAQPQFECDRTYVGPNFDEWRAHANWFPSGEPDATLNACIPAGKIVVVDEENAPPFPAEAKAIWVQKNQTQGRGAVVIDDGQELWIYQNSYVDGLVEIWPRNAALVIADRLTITGNGGEIDGIPPGPNQAPEANIASPPGLETVATLLGNGGAREESLVVHGRLNISAGLDNRAYVVADDGALRLIGWPKTCNGKGHWVAETVPNTSPGRLEVETTVRGIGRWSIPTGDQSVIHINAVCDELRGQFVIDAGTLDIDRNLVTSGRLFLRSVFGSTARIDVGPSTIANFDN